MWKSIFGLFRGASDPPPIVPAPAPAPKIPEALARREPRPSRPVGESGVRQIETTLGVQLPKALKEIIATCGFIRFRGDYFLRGCSSDASFDIVCAARALKADWPVTPKNGVLVPLMYYGMGLEICLWYREGADPEHSKIVWWPPAPADVSGVREEGMLVIANSFDEWITQLGHEPKSSQ